MSGPTGCAARAFTAPVTGRLGIPSSWPLLLGPGPSTSQGPPVMSGFAGTQAGWPAKTGLPAGPPMSTAETRPARIVIVPLMEGRMFVPLRREGPAIGEVAHRMRPGDAAGPGIERLDPARLLPPGPRRAVSPRRLDH